MDHPMELKKDVSSLTDSSLVAEMGTYLEFQRAVMRADSRESGKLRGSRWVWSMVPMLEICWDMSS